MKFDEFIKWTGTTATYATHEKALACTLLGLSGEFGEYLEKLHNGSSDAERIKELGDIFWYIGHLALITGIELVPNDVDYGALIEEDGFILVSQLHEIFKKVIRDDEWVLKGERLEKVKKILESILNLCIVEAEEYEPSMENVLDKTVAKLSSRKERGVLQGSGDNR